MSKEIRITEPKASKCGRFTTRAMKIGNKVLGLIETPKPKPGERPAATFWATNPHVIRLSDGGRFLTVTQAFLGSLASYAVKYIGLRTEDGVTYTLPIEQAKNTGPVRVPFMDIAAVCWTIDMPPVVERTDTLMAKMRLAGGRRKSSVTSASQ